MVIDHVEDLDVLPPASCQCVMSACHISLGSSASKRISESAGASAAGGRPVPHA